MHDVAFGRRQRGCFAFRTFSSVLFVVLVSYLGFGCGPSDAGSDTAQSATIQYIQPNDELGASMATVVGDVPLAHTAQFMAMDEDSSWVGEEDVSVQVDRVLENARRTLREVGAGPDDILKVNVYAVDSEVADEVRRHLAQTFSGEAKPAVAYVISPLPHAEALLAMDVVAVASQTDDHSVRVVRNVEGVVGEADPERGHVAIMPPGGKVYLSGQVAQGEPVEAMRESLESLHDRLAYLGLSADDVIQVKVFVDEISDAEALEDQIAEYYRNKPAPPIVSVAWVHPDADVEVELIAARGTPPYDDEEAITYPTPAGLQSFPQYSRAAEIHQGNILFLSGLYSDVGRDGEGQILDIFDHMGQILEETGTDFNHLAKATYYIQGWDSEVRIPLNSIRADVYDPDRPPTSSLIPVESVGKEGALLSIDMVGVVPE